ncbi:MAG: hypothetical protein ACLSAF_08570 [Intestinimonas sp.]
MSLLFTATACRHTGTRRVWMRGWSPSSPWTSPDIPPGCGTIGPKTARPPPQRGIPQRLPPPLSGAGAGLCELSLLCCWPSGPWLGEAVPPWLPSTAACGSGKTSLAALIAALFPCNVFHMDDFFLPRPPHTGAALPARR